MRQLPIGRCLHRLTHANLSLDRVGDRVRTNDEHERCSARGFPSVTALSIEATTESASAQFGLDRFEQFGVYGSVRPAILASAAVLAALTVWYLVSIKPERPVGPIVASPHESAPSPIPPSIVQVPSLPSPPAGTTEVLPTPIATERIRDHRTNVTVDPIDRREPAPIPPPARAVNPSITSALHAAVRPHLAPCFDDIPQEARGNKPRADVYLTTRIAAEVLRVESIRVVFSDIKAELHDALSACAQAAIGTSIPAPGERDLASYPFAMGYVVR